MEYKKHPQLDTLNGKGYQGATYGLDNTKVKIGSKPKLQPRKLSVPSQKKV